MAAVARPTRAPTVGDVNAAKLKLLGLQAKKTELEIESIRRDIQEEDASEFRSRIYPFTEPIVPETVLACAKQMGEWHRMDEKAPITIVLNSPGGTVFDGLGLYDYIRELADSGHHIEVQGQGAVFSMSGIILQAGTVRSMSPHSYLMIHEVAHSVGGTASKIEDEHKLIQRIQQPLLEILASRSNLTVAQVKKEWTRRDWWLTAEQALEKGFIDTIHA